MTAPIHDGDLISSYARDGEEGAFRALVARHVDLVFATALRQVGDRGVAEEITQNVFVALARKAGALRGYETLAGWLHRTTILEAKARIRSELRRKQREQTAAALAEIQSEGASLLAPLVPLLDEALLTLRDSDRTALISRFLEERSLRDVGTQIGVDEEAARKRVSRALDRLAEFFRARGFALPAGISIAGLFPLATQAAPPALTFSAAQAGLAAGTATGGLGLMLLNFMAFSKAKALVAGAVLVSAPLLWQAKTGAELAPQRQQLTQNVQQQEQILARLTRERDEARAKLRTTTAERYAAEARARELRATREGQTPPPRYVWDDLSPLARVPKGLLTGLDLSTFQDRSGQLSGHMKEVLQLTPRETTELQNALDTFLTKVRAAQQETMRSVPPAANDPATGTRDERRVFEIGDVTGPMTHERERMVQHVKSLLGEERFEIFHNGMNHWMPLTPEQDARRMNFDLIIPHPHTVTFFWGGNGGAAGKILYQESRVAHNMASGAIQPDEVPAMFLPYLQDWVDELRTINATARLPASR